MYCLGACVYSFVIISDSIDHPDLLNRNRKQIYYYVYPEQNGQYLSKWQTADINSLATIEKQTAGLRHRVQGVFMSRDFI